MRYNGFRSANGEADVTPRQFGLATQLLQPAPPAPASQAQTTLQAWQRVGANAQDLALVDVSAPMATVAGPGGLTLEQEVAQAAGLGLALFPDSTHLGLWEFADKLSGARPYKQLVSVGPLTGELGLISRRQQMLESNKSLQPVPHSAAALNSAILAGYKHMLASYRAKYSNAELVLTSGADNARDDISLSDLLSQLHRLYNPNRPVQIVIVMFGPRGNYAAMKQIASVDGRLRLRDQQRRADRQGFLRGHRAADLPVELRGAVAAGPFQLSLQNLAPSVNRASVPRVIFCEARRERGAGPPFFFGAFLSRPSPGPSHR